MRRYPSKQYRAPLTDEDLREIEMGEKDMSMGALTGKMVLTCVGFLCLILIVEYCKS